MSKRKQRKQQHDPASIVYKRFTRLYPCPICGGYASATRASGKWCGGHLSADGEYAHCTSEAHAGGLEPCYDIEVAPALAVLPRSQEKGATHGK